MSSLPLSRLSVCLSREIDRFGLLATVPATWKRAFGLLARDTPGARRVRRTLLSFCISFSVVAVGRVVRLGRRRRRRVVGAALGRRSRPAAAAAAWEAAVAHRWGFAKVGAATSTHARARRRGGPQIAGPPSLFELCTALARLGPRQISASAQAKWHALLQRGAPSSVGCGGGRSRARARRPTSDQVPRPEMFVLPPDPCSRRASRAAASAAAVRRRRPPPHRTVCAFVLSLCVCARARARHTFDDPSRTGRPAAAAVRRRRPPPRTVCAFVLSVFRSFHIMILCAVR